VRHVHAFSDDALGELDAVALVEAINSARVTKAEAVEAAIARTEAVNPALNGLACQAFDQARAKALKPGSDGEFFCGVPTFIKDNADVAGLPMMQGTDAGVSPLAPIDSDVTQLYLDTGLIPLGKTQMSELGLGASAEHPRLGSVRNPWNTDYTAGGSSSGSAAFVAAGAVPIAHANDGGGSIRIPASCNGLVGLKPSRGRLQMDEEAGWAPLRLVCTGVVTRSVRDTAAFYREAERIWRNPKLPPIGDVRHPGKQRLHIAVVTRFAAVARSEMRECSPELRALTLQTAELLEELGHRVDYVEKPPVPSSIGVDFRLYWALVARWQVKTVQRAFGETFDRSRLDNLSQGMDRYVSRNAHRLPMTIMRLHAVRLRTAKFFGAYDAMLTPTVAHETPRLGHLDPTADLQQIIDRVGNWAPYTLLQNVTGEPAISLPLAESSSGMPVGMMLSTGVGREARLLELAFELEEARPWTPIQSRARD
jgi:amidase